MRVSIFLTTSAQQNRPVAQLAERLSPKQEAVGSIPTWPAYERIATPQNPASF